jgi:hypothetical protein
MKKILSALLALILITSYTQAQTTKKLDTDAKIAGQFNQHIKALGKADAIKPELVKKVASQKVSDELVIEVLRLLNAEVTRHHKELDDLQKTYMPAGNKSHTIDKDLLPLLAGIPEPVSSLPQAKKEMKTRYDETVWAAYVEKLERYQKQMQEIAIKNIPADMKDPEKMKQQAYKDAAKAQQALNSNPVIQEMGGLENLQKMTPAQRQAMAKQMTEKIKQDPHAYTGASKDPRMAFTQKMMTDPSYAARFNAMNDAQKKEEYDAFLAENGLTNKAMPAVDNTDAEKARLVIAIQTRLKAINDHMHEMSRVAGNIEKATNDLFDNLYSKVAKQHAAIVDALPLVEMGEAGHEKETYPSDIANQVILYSIHADNAVANKMVWKRKVDMFKVVIGEYNDLLADYWGEGKLSDRVLREMGYTPETLIAGMCGQFIEFTKKASSLTNQHASWQKMYDEMVLSLYE